MTGARVLVTGASKGIGRAIALRLARDGFDVTVHCNSDRAGAEATLAEITVAGGCGRIFQFDVTDRDACRTCIETDIADAGAYYGVVSNAGIAHDAAFPAMSGAEWDSVLATNLDGLYNVLHPCVMPMVQARRGGRIVTLSSLSGLAGNRGQVNYSAAKAGIIGATKALAIELAKRNITVNCVAPGLIRTEMLASVALGDIEKTIPARRIGEPEEVAALVGFLFSPDAAYITRQVISINGGML